MTTSTKMDKDESGKSIYQNLYEDIIGSLLYLTTFRPDILFSVGICARYQSDPKESHLSTVKRILTHLKGSPSLGL